MKFKWVDYSELFINTVESWLDKEAVRFTGMDDGFDEYYRYWLNQNDTIYGENYWVKVILSEEKPIGVIAIFLWDGNFSISEFIVSPNYRGKGFGSAALSEFIGNSEIIVGVGCKIVKAVIYPNNIQSQKCFEKVGFQFISAHPDGDSWNYEYRAFC